MQGADAATTPAFYSYKLNLPVEKDLVLRIEEKKLILRQHHKVKSESVKCFFERASAMLVTHLDWACAHTCIHTLTT